MMKFYAAMKVLGLGVAVGYLANRYFSEDKIDATKAKVKNYGERVKKKADEFAEEHIKKEKIKWIYSSDKHRLESFSFSGDDMCELFLHLNNELRRRKTLSVQNVYDIMKLCPSFKDYNPEIPDRFSDSTYGWTFTDRQVFGLDRISEGADLWKIVIYIPSARLTSEEHSYCLKYNPTFPEDEDNNCDWCGCGKDENEIDPDCISRYFPPVEFNSELDAVKAELSCIKIFREMGFVTYADMLLLNPEFESLDLVSCQGEAANRYGWKNVNDIRAQMVNDTWVLTTKEPELIDIIM